MSNNLVSMFTLALTGIFALPGQRPSILSS